MLRLNQFYRLGSGVSATLQILSAHSQQLQRLNRQLQACLPAQIRPHVMLADCQQRTLCLHADSAAWATRLRFISPQLLQSWRAEAPDMLVDKLQIKVRPDSFAPLLPTPQGSPVAALSPQITALLRSCAENTRYGPLQAALLRLAVDSDSANEAQGVMEK